jgi:hypothetical protein
MFILYSNPFVLSMSCWLLLEHFVTLELLGMAGLTLKYVTRSIFNIFQT